MTASTWRIAGLGAGLTGLMLEALALQLFGDGLIGSAARLNAFVGVLAAGVAVYFWAVRVVTREPSTAASSTGALLIVLVVAAVMRIALLPFPPFLSSDIYRYVWDGQVQAAGINPYRYLPVDPRLAQLRDPAVFPFINRAATAPTIYPPAAQVVFALVGRITTTVTGMKIAMVGFEALAVFCLVRLLTLAGLPRERVLIYAWNPLVLWSFACDGHVDAVAIGLLAAALLLRARHRNGFAGMLLAAAMLVKYLPVVVAPAFVRGRQPWRPALAGVGVAALLYVPYLSVGSKVLGFLPGYRVEEGLDTGSGIWLLAGLSRLGPLPGAATAIYAGLAFVVVAALACWIMRHSQVSQDVTVLCRDTAVLAACTTVALSPHYAWYFAWLAVPSVVAPIPAVVWLSAAPVLLHLDPLNERFLWPALIYVPALALGGRRLWCWARLRPVRLLHRLSGGPPPPLRRGGWAHDGCRLDPPPLAEEGDRAKRGGGGSGALPPAPTQPVIRKAYR